MGKTDKGSEFPKRKFYGILNFTLFPECPQFYSEYAIMNTENYQCYTDKFSIRVLDLTQIEKAGDADSRLLKWARIFLAETMEELEKLAGREEGIREGKSQGQEELLKVLNWLQENGRYDDLQKVLQDQCYREKILGEFNALKK